MADEGVVSCSSLVTRSSFENYIAEIRKLVGEDWDTNQLDVCKAEICGALWGNINSDIIGTGVTASYIVANFLSILFTVSAIVYWEITSWRQRGLSRDIEGQASSCINALFVCVVWLCASIQVASIVLLVKADFGISTTDMEFVTMEITWLVSLLTILPLAPLSLLPPVISAGYIPNIGFSTSEFSPSSRTPYSEKGYKYSDATKVRLRAFTLCWLLSIYPFLSRMLETFSPSKIDRGGSNGVSDTEWDRIQSLCLDGVSSFSKTNRGLITAFGIIGWVWVTIFAVLSLVRLYFERRDPETTSLRRYRLEGYIGLIPNGPGAPTYVVNCFRFFVVSGTITFAVMNLRAVFELQQYQDSIVQHIGSTDLPGWGFGQIVAIMVFGPVLFEIMKLIRVAFRQ